MDQSKLKEQVEIIRQAFGYINQFKNNTFILKIDSTLIAHPFFPILIRDIVLLHRMGIRIVLVPGARTRIDDILSMYNIRCKTYKGVRISSPEAIPFIKMAAFDVSNKIMTMLAENGTNAVIGNWVRARSIGVRDGIDFKSSGMVEKIQTGILHRILEDGLIPIFPNIGWNAKGKPYNLSSSELAYTLSVELNASKLFFLTDTPGIIGDGFRAPEGTYITRNGVVSQLNMIQAGIFLDLNTKDTYNEQLELVSLAYRACKNGVQRVHIIDGRVEGMILKEIFSNRGFGTMIYANQHENIRPMVHSDIPAVLGIMEPVIDEGQLVARSSSELEERLEDYIVYEVDGTIHGCSALHVYPKKQGEIAAVVVDRTYANLGIGKKMISYLIEKATQLGLKSVFVLTTQTSDWFSQLGFSEASISDLPAQRREQYNKKRKSLILLLTLSLSRSKTTLGM